MDDIQKEIEGYLEKFGAFLEGAGPVADILIAAGEALQKTGVSEKVATVIDIALGEVGSVLSPFIKRWEAYDARQTKRLCDMVKEHTEDGNLDEATVVALMRIRADVLMNSLKSSRDTFWENKAKRLEQKLSAATSSTSTLAGRLGRH